MTGETAPPWTSPDALPRLAGWLDTHLAVPGSGSVTLTPLAGGTSGSVLKVGRGELSAVLRATAWPPRSDSAMALEREARLLKALGGSDVPHPALLGWCADETVIGSPFSLIAFVDGWLGSSPPPEPFASDVQLRRQTAYALVDALAALARVDPERAGLSDFGRPENFLERQVDRWLSLMEKHRSHPDYGDRTLPGWNEVADWLRAKRPQMQRVAPLHGDVSYSNILFINEAPARVAAIIDWEIATIGDPLLDLGRALYPFPARDGTPGYSLAVDMSDYPAREDLADHYAERTGLDVRALDYYMALSMFKLAALIEFNHVKSLKEPAGSMSGRIAAFIPQLVAGAREISRSSRL